jgi:hypothetical protein
MRRNAAFPKWLIGFGLAIPLVLVLFAASPAGYNILYFELGRPALLMIWAATGIMSAALSLRSAFRGAWLQSVVALLVPLCLLVVALDPSKFLGLTQNAGNILRFMAMRPSYDARVASLPTGTHPRIVEFDWDGMPWVTFSVVYDESDEIALPREQQSADWRVQAKGHLICDGYGVIQAFWARVNHSRCTYARARGTDGRAKKSVLAKCAVAFVEDHADAASTSKLHPAGAIALAERCRQRADGGSSARPSRLRRRRR